MVKTWHLSRRRECTRLKSNGKCTYCEFSCELREWLEDAGMDEGCARSDEATLHVGGTSNRLCVRVRIPQSCLFSSSINWTPKRGHIFFAAHATKSLCFCKKSMNEKAEKLMNRYICPHILIKEVTMSATANVV